jgi:LemA protein
MQMGLAIAGGVVVALLLVVVAMYNRFVRQRQLIDNSWSNVDTELKRRHDLVPNLVETVRGYATHERATLEEVITARRGAVAATGSPASQAGAENVLVDALRHLMALAEAYPELKANQGFLDLQAELVRTEDRIQAARRFYNANVRDYNTRVQSVPSNLVARLGGFQPADFFEIASLEREAPGLSFGSEDGA